MAELDDIIAKIPKPVLVGTVLILALAFIVSQNPMSDGCEVEVENFTQQVRGILIGYKTSKQKIQFAQLGFMKDQCVQGNSQGSCEDYFKALKKVADALTVISPKCNPKLIEAYPTEEGKVGIVGNLATGIKIMALAAWGDHAPESISQRLGWLNESDIYGFCRMKNKLVQMTSDEEFQGLRMSVYNEFPDAWPESIPLEKRSEVPRPRAFKSASNPSGKLLEKDIYPRSLFSLRCDLYQ